ncbi:MAG: tyrosine-type recombinase/integrase [Hyphomonadaceae bacterium]|nr:tyrosine-type recombinase/integrase [Hyphomonadaceae bacterium]
MPARRLTKKLIDALPLAERGAAYIRDAELPGFGVRVGTSKKSYFVEMTVRGRCVRHTIGPCAQIGLERARQLAKAKLGEMAEGRDPNAEKRRERTEGMTLRAAFDAFFAHRALSTTSVPNYRRSIDLHLADWAGRPIAAVTGEMVLQRHRKIAGASGGVTANNVMRHLSSVWNFTAATAPLPENPVPVIRNARAWAVEKRRRTMIAARDLPRWYKTVMAMDEQARDFLLIALFTGMRSGEIKTLRWEHVDLDARTLTAPKTKNGDPLILPLSSPVHELLSLRRAGDPDGAWLFPGKGRTGHLVEPRTFCERATAASGVKASMHDLRRTFASIAHSVGVSTLSLKGLLNHRTDNDVTGGYVVATADDYREVAERVSQKILELVRGEGQRREP